MIGHGLAHTRRILTGISRRAREHGTGGWNLALYPPGRGVAAAVRASGAAGIICHLAERAQLTALRCLDLPLVNVSSLIATEVPSVLCDNHAVGCLVAEHLLGLGLRRFAFVGHPRHPAALHREAGWRATLAAHGCTSRLYLTPDAGFQTPVLGPRIGAWLAGLPRPVGILAWNDMVGRQVVEACRQAGLAVPEEVAVVGVDDDEVMCSLARPMLSSVALPAEAIGAQAVDLLASLLAGHAPPTAALRLPPLQVVTRHSSDLLHVDDPLIRDALRLIGERLSLTVPGLLRALLPLHGVVPRRTLERRMRMDLHRGVAEEIRRQRVASARRALADRTVPLAEVARRAGLPHAKALSLLMQRELSTTPSAIRQLVGI